ncbi:MAG: carbohydrate kinase family protein [Candidatus Saccharibacteria bacterium]
MSKPKIISIGAAVQDVFLQGELFRAHRNKGESVEEFAMGSKNDVEGVYFSTGGGATNAAVTFARQGFHSYYMGQLGNDVPARAIKEDLFKDKVNISLVKIKEHVNTGYSVLLLAPNGERTILTYRGASIDFQIKSLDFAHTKPDWFYISSLSGDYQSLKVIIDYARKNHIKVAINPGSAELKHGHDFKKLIPDISILCVNKEEAQMIFRGETCEDLVRHAVNHIPFVIITDGPRGSVASDGQSIFKAGMYDDVPVVDRTGAGDAFSSGFTAMIASGVPLDKAMIFASANSTNVVSKLGAKAGILEAGTRLHTMPITIHPIIQT